MRNTSTWLLKIARFLIRFPGITPRFVLRWRPQQARFALIWLFGVLPLLSCCAPNEVHPPLPAESVLVPDHLMIFIHGYLAESEAMTGFVEAFTRQGIPAHWIDPSARGAYLRYHGHSFDFSAFTKAGSDHNTPVQLLADAFAEFYYSLPRTCPICRHRVNRPVEVTLVGHSFGGIVVREFLLREADREGLLESQLPGESKGPSAWKIARVITTGTPFFGSVRTRLTQGFLSIIINGLVRTAVMGFVLPQAGGSYGGVTDAQARALRLGSPYLWGSFLRWKALTARRETEGQRGPPWLVVIGVGNGFPEISGDGVTRHPSANIAPLLPGEPMETYISNLPHRKMIRMKDRGKKEREQELLIRAIALFVETGTLDNDKTEGFEPYWVVQTPDGSHLIREAALNDGQAQLADSQLVWEATLNATQDSDDPQLVRKGVLHATQYSPGALWPVHKGRSDGRDRILMKRQRIFIQDPATPDVVEMNDLDQKLRRLERVVSADMGDVWLRFYDALPEKSGIDAPRVLPLRSPLSFFQDSPERSRQQSDLVTRDEINSDGDQIPVVYSLAQTQSHLISIPDVTPTGPYRMYIRVSRGIELSSKDVSIRIEGGPTTFPGQRDEGPGVPLWIRPNQANLIHIYLDGEGIRARYPKLKRLIIREVALEPDTVPCAQSPAHSDAWSKEQSKQMSWLQ